MDALATAMVAASARALYETMLETWRGSRKARNSHEEVDEAAREQLVNTAARLALASNAAAKADAEADAGDIGADTARYENLSDLSQELSPEARKDLEQVVEAVKKDFTHGQVKVLQRTSSGQDTDNNIGGVSDTDAARQPSTPPTSRTATNRTNRTKITVALPNEDLERLSALAGTWQTNKTTALVRTLRTLGYIHDAIRPDQKGRRAKVYVEDPDGTRREIVLV